GPAGLRLSERAQPVLVRPLAFEGHEERDVSRLDLDLRRRPQLHVQAGGPLPLHGLDGRAMPVLPRAATARAQAAAQPWRYALVLLGRLSCPIDARRPDTFTPSSDLTLGGELQRLEPRCLDAAGRGRIARPPRPCVRRRPLEVAADEAGELHALRIGAEQTVPA